MGTGGKARPGRDADQSPPSSAEVVNEYELYILFPPCASIGVVGLLYLLPSITIRIIKTVIYAGHVRRMWEMINAYRILVGKPDGKIQLEDPDVFRRIKIN
jgi:hypothetical protein